MSKPEPTTEDILSSEILILHDDLTDFSNRCSFLCDAFVGIVDGNENIDQTTVDGLSHYAGWIKSNLIAFKDRLNEIHEISLNERNSGCIEDP